jgi:hypothetical protein
LLGALGTTITVIWRNGFGVHARILPLLEEGLMFNPIKSIFDYWSAQNSTVVGSAESFHTCPGEKNAD